VNQPRSKWGPQPSNVPAGHSTGCTELLTQKEPTGQGPVQLLSCRPTVAPNRPWGQGAGVPVPATQYDPVGQSSRQDVDRATSGLYLPAAHGVHDPWPDRLY
jgi:hypothetical protein